MWDEDTLHPVPRVGPRLKVSDPEGGGPVIGDDPMSVCVSVLNLRKRPDPRELVGWTQTLVGQEIRLVFVSTQGWSPCSGLPFLESGSRHTSRSGRGARSVRCVYGPRGGKGRDGPV